MKFSIATGAIFSTGTSYANTAAAEVLTAYTKAYKNDSAAYIWAEIFTPIKVKKVHGEIYTHGKQAMRLYETDVAVNGDVNEVQFEVRKDKEWKLTVQSLFTDITMADVANSDDTLDAEKEGAEILADTAMLRKEMNALNVLDASKFANHAVLGAGDKFDAVDATPLKSIRGAIDKVRSNCGRPANRVLISYDVLSILMNNKSVLSMFPAATVMTYEMIKTSLPAILGVDKVLVSSAMYNTGSGIDDGDLKNLISGKVFAYYHNPSSNKKALTFGRCYYDEDMKVFSTKLSEREAARTRTHSSVFYAETYDFVVANEECGYLLTDVLSA